MTTAPVAAGPTTRSDSKLGIRTRIASLAAIASVTLFSLMGTVGYIAMVESTRESQRLDLEQRLDAFEDRLRSNGALPLSRLQLDASLVVIRSGEEIPDQPDGTIQVVRTTDVEGVRAIVGTVPTRPGRAHVRHDPSRAVDLGDRRRPAGGSHLVVRGRPRPGPVRRLTRQARAIEVNPAHELLEESSSGDELGELAATLNRLLNKLRLADSDRRRFVSDASHELRTPLMVLSADAEYARDRGGAVDDLARSVLDQTDRLTSLVDDLLTLASIDEGQSATDRTRTVAEVLTAADADGFADGLEPAAASWPIPDITRSVANIVANARRHQTTTVELTVGADGTAVRIDVDDDGPGIPVADREDVFKRFFRSDEGRSHRSGGAGLGLAIARAEVGQAGGTVVAGESPLGGARFTIRVPSAGGVGSASLATTVGGPDPGDDRHR